RGWARGSRERTIRHRDGQAHPDHCHSLMRLPWRLVRMAFPSLLCAQSVRPVYSSDELRSTHVLRRELMYRDELMQQLRLQRITGAEEVAWPYLEPNGPIGIVRKDHGEAEKPHKPPVAG